MLFQRINRTDPEKVFIIAKNAETAALTAGQVTEFLMNGTDDGLAVGNPTANNGALVAGIAASAIPASDYGLVQVYGLFDTAVQRPYGTASNAAGSVGQILDVLSASSCLYYVAASAAVMGAGSCAVFVRAESAATQTASTITTTGKVFIRCL